MENDSKRILRLILVGLFSSFLVVFAFVGCQSSSSSSDSVPDSGGATADGIAIATAYAVESGSDPTDESIKENESIYYKMAGLTVGTTYEFSLNNITPSDSDLRLILVDSAGSEHSGACNSSGECSWEATETSVYLKVTCSDAGSSLDGEWENTAASSYDAISIKQGDCNHCSSNALDLVGCFINMRTFGNINFSSGTDVLFDGTTLTIGTKEYTKTTDWQGDANGCRSALNNERSGYSATTFRSGDGWGYFDGDGAWNGYYVMFDLVLPTFTASGSTYDCGVPGSFTDIPETYTAFSQCWSACSEYNLGDLVGAQAYCDILEGYYDAEILNRATQGCFPCEKLSSSN